MTTAPDSVQYEQNVYMAGLHNQKPPFTFQTSEWEKLAEPTLPAAAWGYIHGNAGAGSTYAKNLRAFDRWSLVPKRLVPSARDSDGNEVFSDTTTKVLGQTIPFPMAIAPIGVQKIFHRSGESGTAAAGASVGIPYIMSTASSTSIEDAASAHDFGAKENPNAPDPVRWYQLYWPSRDNDDITISLLNRAKKAGFTALFVTLDTYVLGWRPSDMDNGYNPFLHADRIGVEIGFTDPVFKEKFEKKHGYALDDEEKYKHDVDWEGGSIGEAAQEWTKIVFPGHSKDWKDVEFLKQHWDGPIVLKGIQSVEDARKSVEAGVQGIVVSNHGGRQQDGGVSSLAMLPRIVAAVGDKLDVFFDSGIRCGADILKAVALGAKCVLVGRPYAYGLALGGQGGVQHVLKSLCGEMVMNMHLSGLRNLSELNGDVVVKEDDMF